MAITDPFVLPADVAITPVARLDPQLRAQLACDEDDFAVSRPRSRTTAKIVDAEMAALLRAFEQPHTIVEAVIGFSRAQEADPEEMLAEAFPLLQGLIQTGLLVPPDTDAAQRILPSFAEGDLVGVFEILRCVQVLDDSEIYQARHGDEAVALKIARPRAGGLIERMIAHEAAILRRLDGTGVPLLLASGQHDRRSYLAMSWCQGTPILDAAEDLRRTGGPGARARLAALCLALFEAYAALHARGVVHADIHPRNVLVDAAGTVTLIDFGLARAEDTTLHEPTRAGVGFYFEPEYARAALNGRGMAPASAPGEQYALAALVYQILTGATYLDFSLERGEMLRQIAEEPPLPFLQSGAAAWPAVERVLARALSKWPEERFPSVAILGQAFRAAADDSTAEMADPWPSQPDTPIGASLLETVLRLAGPGGEWFEGGLTAWPTASVNFGSAGIAYALYRLACARGDASLLAQADIWASRAAHDATRAGAFTNAEAGLDPETVGPISAFHTASGIACVQSLIAGAMGDRLAQHTAVDAFIAASREPCENLDLTLGRSSTLLAATLLLDAMLPSERRAQSPLLGFGNQVMDLIWERLSRHGPIADGAIDNLGIAHGWAGMAYAALRWCQVAGADIPQGLFGRLRELAALAEPFGRGVRWPWLLRRPGQASMYMAGWCNGSAGYVHLWTLAHEVTREAGYLELAEQSAWGAWEQPGAVGNLCCGLAGQAYALLDLYRHTGARDWLWRARELAAQSAAQVQPLLAQPSAGLPLDLRPQSLYKGAVGVAVLLADLQQPERASQPFFERER